MSNKLSNKELVNWLRNWDADNVSREDKRIKKTGEVFTPTPLVQEMLSNIPDNNFKDKTKTFIDPACGNGQFLSEVLIKKLENGIELDTALKTIYGIDIMLDNIRICRDRLLCKQEQYRYIVEKNIVCGDALTFNYDTFTEWDLQ